MAIKPKEYAMAYYLASRGKTKAAVEEAAKGLAAALKKRGAERLLPQVLAELPAAMTEADAGRLVTIESAAPIDDATVDAILKAIGADPAEAETVRMISPELIGGVRIKRRDSVIDATVKGSIGRLKEAMRRGK